MNWESLLSEKRHGHNCEQSRDDEIRSEFFRDYDRIVFSPSFRRLARKTQVHPLSFNDHIHNRLTHSIEVGSVGRSLGFAVGEIIKKNLPKGVDATTIASIVQAACMAHDIGNPPFGHAGEYAIRHWFKENIKILSENLTPREINDLIYFEGNAQGLRVVSNIENHANDGGLRLTYATLGSLIKYPWGSDHELAIKKDKFNIFSSENDLFKDLCNTLGLIPKDDKGRVCRHPLSYLMEAADDICYKIIDIEDALEIGVLRFSDVSDIFVDISERNDIEDYGDSSPIRQRIIPYRSAAIDNLIKRSVTIFIDNYDDIMSGNFDEDILSRIDGKVAIAIKKAKEITKNNIFSTRRKIELEVGSYSTIGVLLNSFIAAIDDKISNKENMSFKSGSILKLIDIKIDDNISFYDGYLLVTDFISGMTDNYATFIAKQISGNAK
ncbi:deoxyguanosinetriphosphate triphosphohydrolase [Yersinia enterocolitica]|uniref:deoxyguanosinetriphosphate triphosphohydrolase n=1 Tax=Yersinia enterocolitica TaxID=630 RepID=UPI0005DAF909|nr:deoxyguanosinetriphosphate triphosphohydrolase [Yersinia enterocolitica]EKN3332171.1 deoxyguanosinetriphosphate triphosphohydrolase [Yersinia enterocolitica]EKN3764452.1 deoxyguanosinetriphosphate triphosphohydrolase [Yersinia enterocolitica]CNJ61767.1 deoxyguanosinetriphosphate triphosphohydrolase [Yersinia enterocolitica]